MPRYTAMITVDAEMSLPSNQGIQTNGFVVSVTFFAKSDVAAAERAWEAFESSEIYKIEIEEYVNSILRVEITELAEVNSFDDAGTIVGQVVFFDE